MKHNFKMLILGAMMLVFTALTTSCAFSVFPAGESHHRTRHVWVDEVYYEQVYYVNNSHQTIIVSQSPMNNYKYNNGRRRHGNKKHY
jgi:uncharacterized protein YegJ (DUF2314 family)